MTTHYVTADGYHVSGEPDCIRRVARIDADMQAEKREWIASLRACGVKAAHPDDGWVDRRANTIHLSYATFNDGLAAGDLLALGWPAAETRIVRVVGPAARSRFADALGCPFRWEFEP